MKCRLANIVVIATLAIMTGLPQARAVNTAPTLGSFNPDAAPQVDLRNVSALIQRAKDSIARNRSTLKSDLDNLFIALLRSHDIADQYSLIDAIAEIGSPRYSSAPLAVKTYVRAAALVVWQRLPEPARGNASASWGYLFPDDRERQRDLGIVKPDSRAMEAAGLKVLRAHELGVSYSTLQDGLSAADAELVEAVLNAGLKVDRSTVENSYDTVWSSLRMACQNLTLAPGQINRVIDLLVARGYPIAYTDSFGHTLLFQLAAECPGPVIGHIADLGVPVDTKTRAGVTPLEMALQDDRFDAADALMERGARISPTAGKRLLLFPRQDLRRKDYVKRATANMGETLP